MTRRIARVVVELGVMPQVLNATPVPFALELAAYAGGAGLLPLESWLQEYCARDGLASVPALLR
jgi:CCR4-NOT transcription complex subunit 1